MIIRLSLLFISVLLVSSFGYSQNIKDFPQDYFINPLDINLRLSGSFGELRSNHFHSGLDIKTNQRTGLPVYAVANGFVSRLKIQNYGYGKALYVTHPNGYVSVYAHLDHFAPRIEKYLKEQQYKKESYEIELFPQSSELRLDQGEIIAYSGNTGGSGGPHLHFEIRDAQERIINPMLFGITIADSKRPVIKQLMAYTLDKDSRINGKQGRVQLRLIPQKDGNYKVEPFKAYGTIGLGINTSDQMDYESNENGVYSITTHLNGSRNFEMTYDRFAFDETRYINAMIDYSFFKSAKSRVSRLYIPDGSNLSMYRNTVNNGKLLLNDPGVSHAYKIEVCDFKNNMVSVNLEIQNDEAPLVEADDNNDGLTFIGHKTSFSQSYGKWNVSIPAGSLYSDELLNIKASGDNLVLHKDEIPVHSYMTLTYDISAASSDNMKQYFIGELQPWGAIYPINTKLKGKTLSATTRNFATYTIGKDDVAPSIRAVNFKDGQWISNNKTLQVSIDDKVTGIANYRATLNGEFLLMEYEYKNKMLTHDLSDKIVKDGANAFKLVVTDEAGNKSTFEATLNFKI